MKKYVLITSGRGPVECCRVVVLVMQKFMTSADAMGYKTEIVDYEPGLEDATMFSVTLSIESDNIEQLQREWEGSILWVAQRNPYRSNHKRKNWFVGLHFFSLLESSVISERDIKYETMRASGPGGQNVNKVETAVRATYVPTGLSVVASDMRSQSQNKKLAQERLLAKLSALDDAQRSEQDRSVWMNHNTLERGNPVKKFKGDL